MKKRNKAALLSGLVFPGLGHIVLKKYVAGAVLAAGAFAALYYLIAKTVQRTLDLAGSLQAGQAQLDSATLAELMAAQSTGAEAQLINIATLVLVLCWLAGIIDSYRIGRAMDMSEDRAA